MPSPIDIAPLNTLCVEQALPQSTKLMAATAPQDNSLPPGAAAPSSASPHSSASEKPSASLRPPVFAETSHSGAPMLQNTTVGAVDVHYDELGRARAALVVCRELTFTTVSSEFVTNISQVAPYEPGAFYKRELPCIRAVLALGPSLELLVIDGYATLDPTGLPGLGAHAAAAIGIPVIGIAKTQFRRATHAIEVLRGRTIRPLFVTAAGGIDAAYAAWIVSQMAGPYRIPTAITRADKLARGRTKPVTSDGPSRLINVP